MYLLSEHGKLVERNRRFAKVANLSALPNGESMIIVNEYYIFPFVHNNYLLSKFLYAVISKSIFPCVHYMLYVP